MKKISTVRLTPVSNTRESSAFVHHQTFFPSPSSQQSKILPENSLQVQIPVLYNEVKRKLPGLPGASQQYLDLCFQLSEDKNVQNSFFQNANFRSFVSQLDSLCGKQLGFEEDEDDFEAAVREETENDSLSCETNSISLPLPNSVPQPASSGGFPAIQAWQLPALGTSPPKKENVEVYKGQQPVSDCSSEQPQIPVISDLEELYESARFASYCMKCGTGVADSSNLVNNSSSSSSSSTSSASCSPKQTPTCAPNSSERPKSSKASSSERFVQNLKMLLSGTAPLVCSILLISYLRSQACTWRNFEQLRQWSCDVFVSSLHTFMKLLPFLSFEGATFKV